MSSPNTGIRLALKRAECRARAFSSPTDYIFESEAMRKAGVDGRGIPAHRTRIVPTGVDIEEFRPPDQDGDAAYRRFGIPSAQKILVFVGHAHERKGVHVLIDAMRILVAEHARDDLHLLVLGNNDDEGAALTARIGSDTTVAPHITLGGYQKDIPALLGSCHIGCIPSTGWDSFPMAALEMQACGLPLVVSDLQGVPETIRPGVTGLVVPAANARALAGAIAELADDEARRARMGAAGVSWIQSSLTRDHQVSRLADAMCQVYVPWS